MELHIATRKGLFLLRRASDWEVVEHAFVGDPVTMTLWDPRDARLYAALNLGHFGPKLHRRDAGGPWQEVQAPVNPDEPSVSQIWSLEADGRQPGGLWCGTIPGALFHSADGGEQWQRNEALWALPAREKWFGGGADHPAVHSILVHPDLPDQIVVAVSVGGVWQTDDGGCHWRVISQGMRAAYVPEEEQGDPDIQDPHLVVACRSQPEHLWAQHHNGIFRRPVADQPWQEIHSAVLSSFGFAVAVHPNDPETAWFVPAVADQCRIPVDGALVVQRTRDGGQSFEVLRSGLPQQHAYDLVFRHALAVSADGNTLVFGTTSGGVWLSEDGGDHWQDLGLRLPPVYCVRIAESG